MLPLLTTRNGPIYALILDILATSSCFHEMDLVLPQMKTDFCPCKDAVFAKAIRIYSQAGILHDALRLFNETVLWLEEMVSQGKTPEVTVWELLFVAVYHSSLDMHGIVEQKMNSLANAINGS